MIINAVSTIPISLSNTMLYSLTSQGRMWPLVLMNLLWGITLILTFTLSHRDALGLSIATLVASLIHALSLLSLRTQPTHQTLLTD